MAREREICLSCSLPVCNPHWAACPLKAIPRDPKKNCRGTMPMKVPEAFHALGKGPMSNCQIAEALGVSPSTVRRWRAKFGYKRMKLK